MKPLNLFCTGTIIVLSLLLFSNAFGQGLSVSEDVKDTNLTREFDKGKGQNPEIVDEGHKPSIFVEPDGTVHMVYFKGIDNLEVKLIYASRKIPVHQGWRQALPNSGGDQRLFGKGYRI